MDWMDGGIFCWMDGWRDWMDGWMDGLDGWMGGWIVSVWSVSVPVLCLCHHSVIVSVGGID